MPLVNAFSLFWMLQLVFVKTDNINGMVWALKFVAHVLLSFFCKLLSILCQGKFILYGWVLLFLTFSIWISKSMRHENKVHLVKLKSFDKVQT